MSGLEIIGIAASVIQLADLGARLSVQLIGFSRKVKEAHKNIEAISQEIAVTGAVLQELGAELKKDENKSSCSRQALETAEQLIVACKEIFQEIEENIELKGPATTTSLFKQRLKYPFFESKLTLLRTKLESLKSSLLVILNVLVFAEQVRNRETLPVLKEQRVLLELLVLEKRSNETKLEQALSETITEPDPPAPAYRAEIATDAQEQHAIDEEIHLSFLGSEVRRELSGHCLLVDRILREIEEPQYNLSARLRGKVQEGALDLHWAEWSHLLRMHGREQVIKAFSRHHAVHSYWTHRYGESTLSRLDPRLNEDTSSRPSQFNPRLVAKAGERARFGHEMTSSRHEDFPVTSIPRLTSDTFAGGIPIPVYPPQEMPTSKWEPQWSLQSDQQAGQHGQYALQDYQLQLLLLEQQNKKKLMMARQERDSAARTDGKHRNAANAEAVERYPVGLPRRTSLNAGSPSWTGTNNAMLSNQSGRKPDDEIREVNDDNTNRSSIRSASPVSPAYSPQGTPPKSGSFEFEGPGAPGTSNARQSRPSSRFEGECNMMEPRPASASNLSFDEQDQNFNLDFSTLDDNDVLENFDFDSFLNTTNDDTFNFDAVVSIGDFEGPFSSTDGLGAKNRVTDEIHTLLADFGGFGEEDLLKLLSETTTDEPVLATN